MDRSLILTTLEKREPLFTTWPRIEHTYIGGDESELGNVDIHGNAGAEFHRLPVITENGGSVGRDMDHVEYRTPETSNAVGRVAFGEAMKQICAKEKYAHKLYCHSVDGDDNTFGGSHENYFTRAPRTDWPRLIPFLIARTVIAGSGRWVKIDGAPVYEISQRARFIETDVSVETTMNRGVINTRSESLANVSGWDRMHVIYSEANRCEGAILLKIGLMQLALEMLEINASPQLGYNREESVSDLRRISSKMSGWFLKGITRGPRGAVDLLGCYVKRAKELFLGRDSVTDAIIVIAEDTLEKLASDPMRLFGRLDWVTKFEVLRLMRGEFPDPINDEFEWLRSQEMEWHNINPTEGLYDSLRQGRQVERIVSDHLIEQAMREPPFDTRAYVRGKTQQLLKKEGKGRELANAWEKLFVVDASFSRGNHAERPKGGLSRVYWQELIPNPFDPGRGLLERIRAKIASGK